jgi:hypothetical protein
MHLYDMPTWSASSQSCCACPSLNLPVRRAAGPTAGNTSVKVLSGRNAQAVGTGNDVFALAACPQRSGISLQGWTADAAELVVWDTRSLSLDAVQRLPAHADGDAAELLRRKVPPFSLQDPRSASGKLCIALQVCPSLASDVASGLLSIRSTMHLATMYWLTHYTALMAVSSVLARECSSCSAGCMKMNMCNGS